MSLITWTKEQFGTNVSRHGQEHQEIFRLVNTQAVHDLTEAYPAFAK